MKNKKNGTQVLTGASLPGKIIKKIMKPFFLPGHMAVLLIKTGRAVKKW